MPLGPSWLPSPDLVDELDRLLRQEPHLLGLVGKQPGERAQPEVSHAITEDQQSAYPMVKIPYGRDTGTLWVGGLPGIHQPGSSPAEVAAIRTFGMDRIVCLIPGDHISGPYGSPDYVPAAVGLFRDAFHQVDIGDYQVPPDDAAFDRTVDITDDALARGEQVLVHCGAGCGRTGMLVCCLMIKLGSDTTSAIRHYRSVRACGPETARQVAYVRRYELRRARAQG